MTVTTLRYVAGTRIAGAMPCRLVAENPSMVALFQPVGTLWRKATGTRGGPRGRNMLPGGWDDAHELVEWTGDGVLRVHTFGLPWSVWRWLGADKRWSERTRDAGRTAVAAVEAQSWPLTANWDEWMPDLALELPMLPDEWASPPGPGTGA